MTGAEMTRGQLLFRRCRGSHIDNVDIAVGFIETDVPLKATAGRDLRINIAALRVNDKIILNLDPKVQILEREYGEYELSNILNSIEYNKAVRPWQGGALLIRETRLRSEEGRYIYLVAMAFEAGGEQINHRQIHTLHQRGNNIEIRPGNMINEEPNGEGIASVHKLPIWGWEKDPWGPVSTMRLDIIDECIELEKILLNPSEANQERRKQLESRPAGGILGIRRNDKLFEQFHREMSQYMPFQWDGVVTKSDSDKRDQKSKEILSRLLAQ